MRRVVVQATNENVVRGIQLDLSIDSDSSIEETSDSDCAVDYALDDVEPIVVYP